MEIWVPTDQIIHCETKIPLNSKTTLKVNTRIENPNIVTTHDQHNYHVTAIIIKVMSYILAKILQQMHQNHLKLKITPKLRLNNAAFGLTKSLPIIIIWRFASSSTKTRSKTSTIWTTIALISFSDCVIFFRPIHDQMTQSFLTLATHKILDLMISFIFTNKTGLFAKHDMANHSPEQWTRAYWANIKPTPCKICTNLCSCTNQGLGTARAPKNNWLQTNRFSNTMTMSIHLNFYCN